MTYQDVFHLCMASFYFLSLELQENDLYCHYLILLIIEHTHENVMYDKAELFTEKARRRGVTLVPVSYLLCISPPKCCIIPTQTHAAQCCLHAVYIYRFTFTAILTL